MATGIAQHGAAALAKQAEIIQELEAKLATSQVRYAIYQIAVFYISTLSSVAMYARAIDTTHITLWY